LYNQVGVPSSRNPSSKPAATIVDAAAKTRSVIEGLQARLAKDLVAGPDDSLEDLECQLKDYFERASPDRAQPAPVLDDLRRRVIDNVADRILREWANSHTTGSASNPLIRDVMDRLVERILEEFQKTPSTPLSGS
jgi:hypothetical protein